ncbi:hypothetical protein VPFG_00285 [Vibrio phage nt-1]|uniref:Uncharacterized protein n=1 Tax=Vibrio phage nt-1 TaxID=115992 RepID=R9TFM2_9CAUD|nr:hypothetical protein VPFG_00285 [Vibrio phage nt-1]AGN30284.1 hypothetical protein VPFG_00285 [Vibrio phage nt-1]
MLKLTIFDEEKIVQVGQAVRIEHVRTKAVETAYVGLIRGAFVALFSDDAIYVFHDGSFRDTTGTYRLAHNAKLTHH